MSYEIIPNVPAGSAFVCGLEPSIVPVVVRDLRVATADAGFDFRPLIDPAHSNPNGLGKPDTIEIRGLYGREAAIVEMASQVMALSGINQAPVQE